ncbi:MAG TPA: CoA transferase [Candidatus Binataceae bacterium]|nr:CoA transferase [Candidatus Binataceae bacterium]
MPPDASISKGPLSGYRIIDVTQMLSGPMATMMLGDQGADVIKVEPPRSGDLTRAFSAGKRSMPPTFAVINRNKRSIALDLKDHRGLGVMKHLIADADVFVQNFRPGAAERMGIGEAELRRIKPDLIYVSISGFGEKGPYAKRRVYDPVIQALSGLAAIQADWKTGRPQMMRLIIPDKVTALTAAQAITTALLARERTGQGQHVRLAMLDAVIAFLWPEGMARHTFTSGESPARAESRDLIFETTDGYITCGANSNAEWEGLANALGHAEWVSDARFNSTAARARNVRERLDLTAEVLATKSSAEWLARLEAHDVPCAPVYTREEVLRDPQVIANELLVESEHPHAGPMRQPRPAARFEATPAGLHRPAPLLGEHTDEVLQEIGISPDVTAELRAAGVIR